MFNPTHEGLGDGISNMVAKTVAAFRKSQENPSILPVIGVVPWSDVPERQVKMTILSPILILTFHNDSKTTYLAMMVALMVGGRVLAQSV